MDVSDACNESLVDVPPLLVALSAVPLLLVSFISYWLDLGLASDIWVSSFRTFLQLTLLGYILKPIFVEGSKHAWVILVYILFMMLLAARETSNRPKYRFNLQFITVFATIFFNVTATSLFAFGVIIRPDNLLDPQYVIPICGMLFGNVITGLSLSLNAMMSSLVEQSSEVELLLCFGATKYEASSRLLREAVRTGTMPTMNSMAVIGLISIPGMMTGQVLGGSPPDVAARYQMLIMYLIAVCGFGCVLSVCFVVMRVAFTKDHQLLTERFTKQEKDKRSWKEWALWVVSRSCCLICNYWCAIMEGYKPVEKTPDDALFMSVDGLAPPTPNSVKVQKLNRAKIEEDMYLEIESVSRSVPVIGNSSARRVLFKKYNIKLGKGEVAVVTGPSGSGKSQLLRLVAGLVPIEEGRILLNGKPRDELDSMCVWRQKVRYVTQYKIETPGTPRSYVQKVANLAVNKASIDAPSFQEMIQMTNKLLSEWGMLPGSLDKEWKELSGGEAQRVIVALAIASRPKVLLLDESTSALDTQTKLRVEKSIERVTEEHAMAVLWITHDEEQINRMEYDRSPPRKKKPDNY